MIETTAATKDGLSFLSIDMLMITQLTAGAHGRRMGRFWLVALECFAV